MREEGTTAGDLPLQILPKGVSLHREQKQVFLSGEVFGGGFRSLFRCREMDKAICNIHGCACRLALGAQSGPFLGPKNLENKHGLLMQRAGRKVKLYSFC